MRKKFSRLCGCILIFSTFWSAGAPAEPPAAVAEAPPQVAPTAIGSGLEFDTRLHAPAGAGVPAATAAVATAAPTAAPAVAPTAAAPAAPAVTSSPRPSNPEAAGSPLAGIAKPIVIEDNPLFPRYAALEPQVGFWTRVFGQYSELQSAVHSAAYPHKIYTLLDFRGDAVRLNRFALDKLRRTEEESAKAQVEALLGKVHAKRHSPELMTPEERRLFDLFADIDDDQRFAKARGTTRAQRGLRERTQAALEISGKYLPEMERIFRSYGLPVRLTRLPLVESSFNVEAYSKVGAAGLWQFIPSSAKLYMRLNQLVDDRRDPWFSTEAAARHLRDDYKALGSWPLALTAYNHGRGGIARGMSQTGARNLAELVQRYDGKSFGFASKNFYTEFLAASEIERNYRKHFGEVQRQTPLEFEVVETKHYVPYETLRRLGGADDDMFRKLNPSYRPEVIEGRLYVPPGHLIRVPAGSARSFEIAYAKLGTHERFDAQRSMFLLHKVARGETLASIAKKYDVSQSAVARANGFRKSKKLRLGQVIKVPPHVEPRPGPVTVAIGESKPQQTREQKLAAIAEEQAGARTAKSSRSKAAAKTAAKPRYLTHRVRSGQTLFGIAAHYNITVAELRSANKLGSSSMIKPGMKLKIPQDG